MLDELHERGKDASLNVHNVYLGIMDNIIKYGGGVRGYLTFTTYQQPLFYVKIVMVDNTTLELVLW